MPLIKDGRLAEDRWTDVADDQALDDQQFPIVSLERWQAERETLLARNAPIGIHLRSDQSVVAIAEDLERFEVIALDFPKFTDGRAYSNARLLRERYGFGGELRAVGNVLRDQFLFLQRCGFDALVVTDETAVEGWVRATSEISVAYQPTGDGRLSVLSLRQRRAAARTAAKPLASTSVPCNDDDVAQAASGPGESVLTAPATGTAG